MALTGGCLCGQARYEIAEDISPVGLCHCKNCQRQGGSSFSINLAVKRSSVTQTGTLVTYVDHAESGAEVHRRFCPKCGSPLFSELPHLPDLIIVKAGTLDDTSELRPAAEVWCKSKQPWVEFSTEYHRFESNPGLSQIGSDSSFQR